MNKRPSIDEYIGARKAFSDDSGKVYKSVVLDEVLEKSGFDKETRSQRFVMSSENPDLMNDIVRQAGLSIDNFLKNPVALAYHSHNAPIGKWLDVKQVSGKPKRTEGTIKLFDEGVTDKSDEIARLLQAGGLKACSIGFMPKELEFIKDKDGNWNGGFDIIESSLLECSVCSIPANPDALAKAAGGDMHLAAEALEFILDTYCEKTSGGLFVRKDFEQAYTEFKSNKTVHPTPKEIEDAGKAAMSVALDVDTKATEEKLGKVETMLDRILNKFAKLAGFDGDAGTAGLEPEEATGIATEKSSDQPEDEGDDQIDPVEDEPAVPVLIEGSLEKAKQKSKRLRARLQAQGAL